MTKLNPVNFQQTLMYKQIVKGTTGLERDFCIDYAYKRQLAKVRSFEECVRTDLCGAFGWASAPKGSRFWEDLHASTFYEVIRELKSN